MSRRIEWFYYFNVSHDYEMQLLLYNDFVFLWHSAKVKALCSHPVFGPSNWRISGVFCHSDFMETCQERRGLFTVGSRACTVVYVVDVHIVTFYFIASLPTSWIGSNFGQNRNLKKRAISGTLVYNVWLSYSLLYVTFGINNMRRFRWYVSTSSKRLDSDMTHCRTGLGKCSVICC